ncbi:RadC family protein [Paucidesulfovibrio longus]|uniref:RadC family protein n=1 Tax=Paucidesulfovibrio longus TaxID=889 RepID=UPI0003B3869C|nr:DNA repair protein RadC [Paucidesulfovibrio longus]
MDKPHYHGHRERLRERLLREPRGLADYEILELLLARTLPRQDTKPLAKELLRRFGSLHGALYAPEAQLAEIKGFGAALASSWALYRELWARLREPSALRREVLSGPEMVAEGAKARFGAKGTEEFWVALVDNQNRVISWECVSKGTVDQTAVYPREVMSLALRHQAAGMILVHNHPGGSPEPSDEDVRLTLRIKRAADDLGVRLLDHLVVTDREHYSFQGHGLL